MTFGFSRWAEALRVAIAAILAHRLRSFLTVIGIVIGIAVVTVVAALMTAADGGFAPMSTLQWGQLAAAAVFLAAGHALTIAATRGSDLAIVSPFRYSALVAAVALGWLVWGEVPNLLAWGGIALLIASGVALLRLRR